MKRKPFNQLIKLLIAISITLVSFAIFYSQVFRQTTSNQSLESNQVKIGNLSFNNPHNLSITTNDFHAYENQPNIFINIEPITDFIEGCVDLDVNWRKLGGVNEVSKKYLEMLNSLKMNGSIAEIEKFDFLTCNNTKGSIKTTPITINGLNGAVQQKALSQSGDSINVFYTQVLVIDKYDKVYSIVFSYTFDELGKYIESISNQYGSAYTDGDDYDEDIRKYKQVLDFFKFDTPITDEKLKNFETNKKLIDDMIKTITIYN